MPSLECQALVLHYWSLAGLKGYVGSLKNAGELYVCLIRLAKTMLSRKGKKKTIEQCGR